MFSVLIFMTVGFFIYSRLPDSIISAWNDSDNTINDDGNFINQESDYSLLESKSSSSSLLNFEEETKKPNGIPNKVDQEQTKDIKPTYIESTSKVKEEYIPLSCGPRYQVSTAYFKGRFIIEV